MAVAGQRAVATKVFASRQLAGGRRRSPPARSADSSPLAAPLPSARFVSRPVTQFTRPLAERPSYSTTWTAVVVASDASATPTFARDFTGPDFPPGLPRPFPERAAPARHRQAATSAGRRQVKGHEGSCQASPPSPRSPLLQPVELPAPAAMPETGHCGDREARTLLR